ncbi:MAG: type II secretion system F family protein [Candidatus Krumholzibacteriia bacterium]
MGAFRYVAKTGPGQRVEGVLQGESSAGVARILVARGMFPVAVTEVRPAGGAAGRWDLGRRLLQAGRHRPLASGDLALFTRRLGDLLEAGVPMQKAVTQLHLQTRERHLRQVLGGVAERVRGGESLSGSLAACGVLFPRALVGAVEAGETGGSLVPVLQGLAALYEKDDDLRRTVRAALIYPALVLTVSLATLLVMFLYLLPRLSVLYADLGQELPGPTRLLLAISGFLAAHGTVLAAVLAAVAAALAVLRARSARLRRLAAVLVLRLPVLGRIILDREIVRFAHTLASLVGGGVPLMRGLWFAARTAGNAVVAEELRGFSRQVGEGASLSGVIAGSRIGDNVLVMMVQVGEEMGQLAEAIGKACRIYERGLNERMKVITTVLEPALIVAIGLVVGFIVFSMMLPIMELDLS